MAGTSFREKWYRSIVKKRLLLPQPDAEHLVSGENFGSSENEGHFQPAPTLPRLGRPREVKWGAPPLTNTVCRRELLEFTLHARSSPASDGDRKTLVDTVVHFPSTTQHNKESVQ